MRADVHGTKRVRILLSGGPGIKIKKKGERRRKSIRGNQIAEDIAQINLKVVKEGEKRLGIVLGKESEEKPEEKEGAKKEEGNTNEGNQEKKE